MLLKNISNGMKNVREMCYGVAYFTFRLLLYDIRR